MLKSLLLRFPWLYELVQRARDRRYFAAGSAAGTFSQHGEDRLLLDLLKSTGANGSYVDVGCNHPFKLSNTFLLYLHGWRGVCVDPLPRLHALYRRWRADDAFVCTAVGPSLGAMPFFEFESDVLSTLDANLASSYQATGYRLRKTSEVAIRPIDSILEERTLKLPLSLLSIDIEGHELQALRSIDLDRWRPQFVCLEVQTADGAIDNAAAEYLQANGYAVAQNLGLNLVFRRVAGESAARRPS